MADSEREMAYVDDGMVDDGEGAQKESLQSGLQTRRARRGPADLFLLFLGAGHASCWTGLDE